LSSFRIHTKGQLSGQIVTFANETIKDTVGIDQGEVILKDVNQIYFSFNKKMAVQFCLMNSAGKTQNTKAYKSGQMIDIPDGMRIAALRLSDT
jgi:hypothetical protein